MGRTGAKVNHATGWPLVNKRIKDPGVDTALIWATNLFEYFTKALTEQNNETTIN